MVIVIALLLLAAFYIAYIIKLLMLRRQNIQADILGRGQKPRGVRALEIALKCVTYLGAAVQFIGALLSGQIWSMPAPLAVRTGGCILMFFGAAVFILAIVTMKNNWRAGYSEGQNTELVTNGVYLYSRNPAFLGFDLLYIGCAMAFPNPANIFITVMAVILFHRQIRGEEKFLSTSFGQAYWDYQRKTMRYLGRRRG